MKRLLLALTLVMAVPLQALALSPSFGDVSTTHKNFYAVEILKAGGIIGGYPDGTFKPEGNINRAEFAKILVGAVVQALEETPPTVSTYNNCFPDVKTEWFAPYVCYAKEKGWIQGYPDGTFKPTQNVNRAETLKMLFESTEPGSAEQVPFGDNLFTDVDTNAWFAKYVNLAQLVKITEETSGLFRPAEPATRGVVAEYILRKTVVGTMGQPYDTDQLASFIVGANIGWIYDIGAYESPLEITKFMKDPAYFGESSEYVEIRNNGSTSINLRGYYLVGKSLFYEYTYTFGNVTLGAGESLRVYSSGGTYSFGQGSDIWDDNSEVNLYDPNGHLEYYYG